MGVAEPPDVLTPKKKGSRVLGVIIPILIVLFFIIDYFIRGAREFSPSKVTSLLLWALQFIVLLLALILLFVLGRNLVRLYLERKRKVVGSHFKIKLVFFFTALSFIPTFLLLVFAGNLLSRNIEQWFKLDYNRLLEDTKAVADGFYVTTSDLTLHYAQQLSVRILGQNLNAPENRVALENLVKEKLREYQLDEIGIIQGDEELFTYFNPQLPLEDYQDLLTDSLKRAHAGETIKEIKPMGSGEFIRLGLPVPVKDGPSLLVITGKFLPQNYAQKINTINAYWDRYSQLRQQKDMLKNFFLITLVFVTILIVFAATWIGFHIAKSITVPIEKLAQATREVSKGNLDVRVEDPASDEIGILIDSFNQMIADIKSGQERLAQKTAEQEARKQYIETLLNTVTTGVLAVDAAGVVTTINPSARDILALTDGGIVGLPYRQALRHERYADLVAAVDGGMKSRHRLSDREIQLTLNGQPITIALTLSPLRTPSKEFSGLIVVLDDLSQLIRAQRIAAWKEVAQRVAHEIKNPLTPIQLNAERIIKNLRRTEPGVPSVIEEGARVIIQEAQTIKSLVDEFSDFARLPKINLQPTALGEIIEQVKTLFRGIFQDIAFEVILDPDLPPRLPLDPEQIKRVFINLIDNAIDAMNKKGKILIHAVFDREAQQVRVEVADSGPGIPVEDKDKLFLPHFSTKKKGTGLGLAIVSQIMKEHNGAVEVHNIKPHGAQFTLHIPA